MPRKAVEPRGKGLYRFQGKDRIKKGMEIRRILQSGRSVGCRGMKLSWEKNSGESSRMAIALRRGYGNAVQRNRAKRLIRESFRLLKPSVPGGYNLVFVVFPGSDEFGKRRGQVSFLFSEAGLLPRKRP
jgi:ribonuclease P protein component